VVNPETLSNQAFTNENSPPQIKYGNIPTTHDNTHEPTTIIKPSLVEIEEVLGTKINGKHPSNTVRNDESSSG
jgi:ornithine cyclodeaminase/alanine dehydrogenase-like protein (mu-crystallin family)